MENSNKLTQFTSRFPSTEIDGLSPMANSARLFLSENDFPTTREERFKSVSYTHLTLPTNREV